MKTALLLLCAAGCYGQTPAPKPAPRAATRDAYLSWVASPTPNVTYFVYRVSKACAGATGFAKLFTTPISALTYNDVGLNAGTYCYYVTSYLSNAVTPESVPSNTVQITIDTQPAPPSNLQVTPSSATVAVPGGRQQFSLLADGIQAPATWAVNPPEGSINGTGLYTAPGSIKGNNVKVQVLAQHASGGSATADITLRK